MSIGNVPQKLLIISGPTACAKSLLACALAPLFTSSLLSIDSVQVYSGLDIGSAKLKNLPANLSQQLVDIKAPDQHCNVSDYINAAKISIENVIAKSETPVFVGGSSLYITCLLHGLADMPEANQQIRTQLASLSAATLYAELERVDADSARKLHPNDRLRIERAIETYYLKGVSASKLLAKHAYQTVQYVAIILVPIWPREVLYQRINERCESMLNAGWIEETEKLVERYGECVALQSLGYAEILEYLKGKITRQELTTQIAQATRNYAKRQLTFWRNEPAKRGWKVKPSQDKYAESSSTAIGQIKESACYELTLHELKSKLKARLDSELNQAEVWYINAPKILTEI